VRNSVAELYPRGLDVRDFNRSSSRFAPTPNRGSRGAKKEGNPRECHYSSDSNDPAKFQFSKVPISGAGVRGTQA